MTAQDVIGRGSKLHPLYARVVDARAPRAVVVPVHAQRGLQVLLAAPLRKPGSPTEFLCTRNHVLACFLISLKCMQRIALA